MRRANGRTNEILELFVAQQVDLRILSLPAGADPCDFLAAHGGEAFQSLVDNSVDALEHRLRSATAGIDALEDTHASHQAIEEVLSTLAKATSGANSTVTIRVDQMLHRLARKFGVSEDRLRSRVAELRRRGSGSARPLDDDAQHQQAPLRIADPWQRELAVLLVSRPASLSQIRDATEIIELPPGPCRTIVDQIIELFDAETEPSFERLLLAFDDPRMKDLLISCDEECGTLEPSEHARRLTELVDHGRRRQEHSDSQKQLAILKKGAVDESTQLEILERMIEQKRARQSIPKISPTDG